MNPFFLCLLLLGVCLALLWLYGDSFLLGSGFLFVLFLFVLCSTGWLPQAIIHRLEAQYPVVNEVDPAIHWIVVLSGGQSEAAGQTASTLLSSASLKRFLEGLRLYRQLPAAKLLLSGGGYRFKLSEAARMAELAAWCTIPANNLVLETTSINTADQAKAIKDILQEEPFYLVTSAMHMPRAMILCQAQGLHPIAAPTDFTLYWNNEHWRKMILPSSANLFYLGLAMHEVLGRIWITAIKLRCSGLKM